MRSRQVLIYFAWSRPGETGAPLPIIDDRFPAIFELRRLFYPKFEELAHPSQVDQGIGGFLDHVQKPNFAAFAALAATQSGRPVRQVERVAEDGVTTPLGRSLLSQVDTLVIISFDSLRTGQAATPAEIDAVQDFLASQDHLAAVCPHHDIGTTNVAEGGQLAEHLHHGDPAIPPRQVFGGFARTLLAGLGVPVLNRFGLRPASNSDGTPVPLIADRALDRLGLLRGVDALNLHPHLPHFECLPEGGDGMDVLVRQRIDMSAPPHPFTAGGRDTFDAVLQSKIGRFAGTLLVGDTTLWSSTAGGLDDLRRLWSNVLSR